MLPAVVSFACCVLIIAQNNIRLPSFRHRASFVVPTCAMRLLDTLALATSAVMAFNQPRQDSPVLLDHQQ
ncbi:unnamed protein product, partial [Aphanomyces euteiches]